MYVVVLAVLVIFGTTEHSEGACRVDQLPENGWAEYKHEPFSKLTTGDLVDSATSISYKCNDHHFLDGRMENLCFIEKWTNPVPECKPFCSPEDITGDSFVATECFYNDTKVECSSPAPPGTVAIINCREMYQQDSENKSQYIGCGVDGSWNPSPEDCSIPCGRITQNVTKTPWSVRIVRTTIKHFTLGTIINARMLLTIANQFWNIKEQKSQDLSEFVVQIVRNKRILQEVEVQHVAYPPNHLKFREFTPSGNIAIAVLRTSIVFKPSVIPACLPFELDHNSGFPTILKGRTDELDNVVLQVPTNCYSDWNSTAGKPLPAIDIFCSNLLENERTKLGSGFASSFTVTLETNAIEVFHLLGILIWWTDVSPDARYLEFQNILFYKEFIEREIAYVKAGQYERKNSNFSLDSVSYGGTIALENTSTPCGITKENATKTPWDVLIIHEPTYSHRQGTIVNDRMVLSVAYPFWNRIEQKTNNLSDFYVRILRGNFIHQEIEIERVSYAPTHNKLLAFPSSGNIAVLLLSTPINFKPFIVAPVCLPFDIDVGVVTRSTFKGRTPQQDNLILQHPIYCYSDWNSKVKPVAATDVLCTNELQLSSKDLQDGSSFTVPIETNGTELFYLLGIRTWAQSVSGLGRYFDFQNVLFYKDFIQNEISCEYGNECKRSETTILSSLSDKNGYCRADNIPQKTNAYYESNLQRIEYGEVIQNFAQIFYRCIPNHVLYGNAENLCVDGKWVNSEPECKPRCDPKKIQGLTVIASCQFHEEDGTIRQASCTEFAPPGTGAFISCRQGYERFDSHQQITVCGADGEWNPLPKKCTPICGEISQGIAYVVGGRITEISKAPWHAGVYKKNTEASASTHICGGSIITTKVVISAMHCFWHPTLEKVYSKEDYDVAVGKSLRELHEVESLKPQFFKIADIFYEEGYDDYSGNYVNDIAILVLNDYITFKSYIVPVCLQFGLMYDEQIVQPGVIGKVAGWGLEGTNMLPSKVLKEIELPVVSRSNCIENSPTEFKRFITSDKFCAGYLTGQGVCQGDSGGGFVVPQTKGTKTVYFLRGIVSTGPSKDTSCDSYKYTTFTNVAYYTSLIKEHFFKHEPIL